MPRSLGSKASAGKFVTAPSSPRCPPLKWVMSERMTNQSLRDRFRLAEDKAAIASQIIAATIEAGMIKPDESVGASRKFARYLPFWA